MRVVGFSSGGTGHIGNTDRLVMTILNKNGMES